MKKILLIPMFIIMSAFGQIPDYFGNNPIWKTTFHDFVPEFPGNEYWRNRITYVEGDTSFNGYTYYKLYQINIDPITQDTGYQFLKYYRQEGRSIYRNTLMAGDQLIINYDSQIGDNMSSTGTLIVQELDSVYIGGMYRRVLYADNAFHTVQFIEGVGVLWQEPLMNECYGNNFTDITYPGVTGVLEWWLHSYSENGTELWNVDTNICTTTLSHWTSKKENDFVIYPNPASELINILGLDQSFNYRIYNMAGIEVLSGSSDEQIIINNLSKGMYYLVIKQDELSSVKRFIVQ